MCIMYQISRRLCSSLGIRAQVLLTLPLRKTLLDSINVDRIFSQDYFAVDAK